VFTIEMLPAQRGDALWITYGEEGDLHHVLIDGGPKETLATVVPELERRIAELPGSTNRLELLVVTHIDADHIQGILSLLSGPKRVKLFRDVWFNGFKHLGLLGGPEGEMLTAELDQEPGRWNKAFKGGPVVLPDTGKPPTIKLRGGLELTLLTPTAEALAKLAPKWEKEVLNAGLVPGVGAQVPRTWKREEFLGFDIDAAAAAPYSRDRAEPNGSSITFIASYAGKRVLCAADAHSEMLAAGLDRLGPGPHEVNAVKLSHHGSRGNVHLGFLERVQSPNWLISTNGANFGHPHAESLARIVVTQNKPTFHLNYVTPFVEDLISGAGDRYRVKLPKKRRDGTFQPGLVVRMG
jgi:beta-lactamase superfamily II metal-dependent hydrolase